MMVTAEPGCRHCRLFTVLISLSFIAGCSRYIDPNVPELIRPYTEPEFGCEYLLYRPSSYDKQYGWPLIVVCAGAFPDSPNQRIRAWTQHAEKFGFLVVSPTLEGNRASWLSSAAKQIPEQREDEKRILSTIRHIRAGQNVSDDRIFIHGWSGGAPVALRTGLRHPDVFRAIALSQPRFDEACLADTEALVDRHQPVFVHYDISDVITGRQGSECVEWLRSHIENLLESPYGSVRPDEMEPAVEFFEDVVRKVPWIRIRAIPSESDHPLEVQFKLRCSFEPTCYRWSFGDGEVSTEAEPIHTYAEPGDYVVSVSVDGSGGREHTRSVLLCVPEGVLTNPVGLGDTGQPNSEKP